MATFVTNHAAKMIADGTLALLTDTIKAMLVDSTYVGNRDDDFVDDGSANDPQSHEVSGTGYTGGFGGAGRKTLASKTLTEDDANDRAAFDAADTVWTGLTVGTIGGVVLIKEITNDAASLIIAFLDATDLVTNGGDVTAVWAAAGLIDFSTV